MDSYGKQAVRIRLLFDEPGMLSKAQLDQGVAKSWYLVNADAFSIGQVAARIEHDYLLADSCPQGILLEMRGFVLPPGQSARILQDSDLVRVRRKHEGVHSRELVTNSLSVDNEEIDHGYRIGRGGILAIDEFEKEAGGYQGELSDDEDAEFSLSSGEKVQDDRKRLRSKESSGKKRKRSHTQKDVLVSPPKLRIEPEGLEPSKSKKQKSSGKKKHEKSGDLQIVALDELPRREHLDGGVSTITEKKQKKKKKGSAEQTRADIDASPSKEANALEITPSKRRKVKSVKEKGDPEIESGLQKLKPESSHKKEKSKKRQDTNPDNHDQEKSSQVEANNGDSLNDEEAPKQADIVVKKPSRSALRKKAKKRWLREHGQNGIVPKKDDVKAQPTQIIEQAEADSSESESSEDEAETGAPTEIEAEEEILPRICAPGHIRFEPVEDARDEERSAAPVLLSYTDVRCKKQGQAWGQEKSRGRYSEDGYKRSDRMESRQSEGTLEQPPSLGIVAKKIDFENLPLLSRAPTVGDVLAYQLVELTASWTPELSSYRVGKVSMYDEASTMITLAPVPEYPIHTQQPEDVEDESLDENEFLPPYTPDGTLEVNLATLMEVRVVEEGPVQAKTLDVNATTVDVPMQSPQPAEVPQEPTASTDHPQNDHAEGSNGGEVGRAFTAQLEPVLDQPTDAGWQDMLSEEINNKKRELALKASKELEGQNGEGSKKGDNGKRNTRVNGAPIIRHRYMRTGALGPTMALLRASQTL